MAGHTPGPWRMGADLERVHPAWRDSNGSISADCMHRNGFAKTIATVGKADKDWRPIEQMVADARLIAAAPDLLEAAMMLASLDDGKGRTFPTPEQCAFARAAIAAATGDAK